MFFPFLLMLLLLPGDARAQEHTPSPVPSLAEAQRLADEGDTAAALDAFRRITVANPDDHAARMAVGRLHQRLGHPDLAASVYESVLLEDPFNVEARLSLASMLVALDDSERAIEILEVVEESEKQNAAVLTSLGRAHRLEGHDQLSVRYYERAAAADPTIGRRVAFESARASHGHRFEARGIGEQYSNNISDTRGGDFSFDARVNERVRILGRAQVQRKLGFTEHRIGGGAAWEGKPGLTLRGHALFGPDNLVMPEGDFLGEVAYEYHGVTWMLGVRHFDFTGARTLVISPAVSWAATERMILNVRYAGAHSVSNTFLSAENGHSAHVRADVQLQPRLWLQAGFASGIDDFEIFSIDQIGDFRANALSGGLRIDLPSLTSILARYQHQWRSQDVNVGRFTVILQQSF